MTMRIAVFVEKFPVLSETFVLNQITGLIDRGHDVQVYSWRPTNSPGAHGEVAKYRLLDRTHYWPDRKKSWTWRLIRSSAAACRSRQRFRPFLRSLNPTFGNHGRSLNLALKSLTTAGAEYDVLLCHFGKIGREVLDLRRIGAISGKLVTIFHGYDMSSYLLEHGEDVYSSLLEHGDLFLPISEHWRRRLIELGADDAKILVHRMGIDCSRFTYAQRELPKSGPVKLISVARLVEKKGIEYSIRAVAKLIERGFDVDYSILGDGPLRSSLEELITKLNLGHCVHLDGWQEQDEVVARLGQAHVLLCPSVTAASGDMEGLPVALMEALAQGLPVVSTYHSGIPELIEDGKTGLLVEERDYQSLADKLAELLEHPAWWPDFTQAGRQRVSDEFEIDKLNSGLESIFEGLL